MPWGLLLNKYTVGVALLAVIVGGAYAYHLSALADKDNEIAAVTAKLTTAREELVLAQNALIGAERQTQAVREAKAVVERDRDKLVREIDKQNGLIQVWRSRAQVSEAQAQTRLAQITALASQERREIANLPGTGPQEMNRWLQATFPAR